MPKIKLTIIALILSITGAYSNPTTKTAVDGGDWGDANSWVPTGVPGDGDVIHIPENITMNVTGQEGDLSWTFEVNIDGTLYFDGGKISCSASSSFNFSSTGTIGGTATGSDQIRLGSSSNKVYQGSNCGTMTGPFSLDNTTSCVDVLPVNFIDFKAEWNNEASVVELEWVVSEETEIINYTIYYSANGLDWLKSQEFNQVENNNGVNAYAINDYQALGHNRMYYKIIAYGKDNSTFESKIAQVAANANHNIHVYPNPSTQGEFNIEYHSAIEETITITVINTAGKVVLEDEYDVHQGTTTILVDDSVYQSGLYILEVYPHTSNAIQHIKLSIE